MFKVKSSPSLIEAVDLYATILEMFGVTPPSTDSVSFKDDLYTTHSNPREFIHVDKWPGLGTPP